MVASAIFAVARQLDGGEGGIRTPDTVARMPHFECGAFNHSATSPQYRESASVAAQYLAVYPQGHKAALSEFLADLAVERIRPAAAQRDGETHQSPDQDVFIAAVQPRKPVAPVQHGDDEHFDRCRRREKSGEQAQ